MVAAIGLAALGSPGQARGAQASDDLIRFNPETCEFGAQLQPYFDKATATVGHPEADLEEEKIFPVDRTFRGLRVKYLVIGYEWSGVTFAESPLRVRAVFRDMGHDIDRTGTFAMPEETDVVATLTATKPDQKVRGESQLICGI